VSGCATAVDIEACIGECPYTQTFIVDDVAHECRAKVRNGGALSSDSGGESEESEESSESSESSESTKKN
jgi:hypothetical protein